jgi:hypothetical protein
VAKVANLVQVADGAYPHDDYSFLPAEVVAWWGYLGGATPHAWTSAEIAHLEQTDRPFWSIWTAPGGRIYTASQAVADAHGMVAALTARGRAKNLPVALDVEESTYEAYPAGANASAAYWCHLMRASGYPNAVWYGPCRSEATWRACWDQPAPTSLPPGVAGVQYDHALANDRYDISVFDPSYFGVDDMPTADEIAAANWTYPVQGTVHADPKQPVGTYVANVNGRLVDISAEIAATNAHLTDVVDRLDTLIARFPAP